jgi:hypothetical protein
MKILAERAGYNYTTPWDAMKIWGCVCDKGYRGPDCSQQVYPPIPCEYCATESMLTILFVYKKQECLSRSDPLGGFGNEAGRDCSGRGHCDYESGTCKCFGGFHGAACNKQSITY